MVVGVRVEINLARTACREKHRRSPIARGHAAVNKRQVSDLALVGVVGPRYRKNVPAALWGERCRDGGDPAGGVPDEAAGRGVAPSVTGGGGGSRVVGDTVDQGQTLVASLIIANDAQIPATSAAAPAPGPHAGCRSTCLAVSLPNNVPV